MSIDVLHGDCLEVMRALPDNSIHAVVTDPPYGLSFMGKLWDKGVPGVPFWAEMLRVLKPGGHLLSFAGSRTYHRLAVAIEDAGFEVRDQIMWVYGSGFPKSLDISKALDKMVGAEREVIGIRISEGGRSGGNNEFSMILNQQRSIDITIPATDTAKQWQGWGTALKPAHEPLCLARKPLSEKNVAANVLKHGTGGLDVDGCRIGTTDNLNGGSYGNSSREVDDFFPGKNPGGAGMFHQPSGRYPANLIHDGSPEVLELFPETKGRATTHGSDRYQGKQYAGTGYYGTRGPHNSFTDTGSAARYFYCAKASRAERQGSKHPTIKPLALMRYLVRLITPPGGTVLDPFAGSGTTGQAALLEGFNAILIEREAEYMADIKRRLGMEAIA